MAGVGCLEGVVIVEILSMLANNVAELKQALDEAKRSPVSTLIEIPVEANSMSGVYDSWWRVAVAEVSTADEVNQAFLDMENHVKQVKPY